MGFINFVDRKTAHSNQCPTVINTSIFLFFRYTLMIGTMQMLPYMISLTKPFGIKLLNRITVSFGKLRNYVKKLRTLKKSVFIRYKQTSILEKRR